MSPYEITVAQYGNEGLPGAWHYSILCYNLADPNDRKRAICFQLVGGEGWRVYEMGEIKRVVARHTNDFKGELLVGHIAATSNAIQHLTYCAKLVKIRNRDSKWNCQNWVAEVLTLANSLGVQVNAYTRNSLYEAMQYSYM